MERTHKDVKTKNHDNRRNKELRSNRPGNSKTGL